MQGYIRIKVKIHNNYKGLALKKLGKFNDAIIMYDRALLINPNDADTYHRKCIRF